MHLAEAGVGARGGSLGGVEVQSTAFTLGMHSRLEKGERFVTYSVERDHLCLQGMGWRPRDTNHLPVTS